MANDILGDLIMRDVLIGKDNQLKLFQNISYSMYPARALAIGLQKIHMDSDEKYIRRLAGIFGKNSADTVKHEFDRKSRYLKKEYQQLPIIIEISGFGKLHSFKENKDKFIIQVKDHPVIIRSNVLYGKKSIACVFYGQIYAEYLRSFYMLKKPDFMHTKCICRGDKFCEWTLKK